MDEALKKVLTKVKREVMFLTVETNEWPPPFFPFLFFLLPFNFLVPEGTWMISYR